MKEPISQCLYAAASHTWYLQTTMLTKNSYDLLTILDKPAAIILLQQNKHIVSSSHGESDPTAQGKLHRQKDYMEAKYFWWRTSNIFLVLPNVIHVPWDPGVSFAAVRLLWTVVSQSFMIQWNFDECNKWSVKKNQSCQSLTGQTLEKGIWEQCLSWKMTGNSRMTSVMAQCKACLMKWRNQWASITPFKTCTPRDSSCELKKDIFHVTTEEIGAELEYNQNQHQSLICSD